MRVAEHLKWDRGLPLRYLLVREDFADGDPEAVEVLARCADVEGLYLPTVPPERELLTLQGCPRDSELARLATRPAAADRLLGRLEVVVLDATDRQGPESVDLVDVSVVTVRPTPDDPGRIDIVVGAGVHYDDRYGTPRPPASPAFEIWPGVPPQTEPVGTCLAVSGLYARRSSRPRPIRLIGCEPNVSQLNRMREPRPWRGDWGKIVMLDRAGGILATHDAVLDVISARPSVLGGTLLDLTLADGGPDRPPLEARAVRERWVDGPPTARNQWAPLPTRGRSEWLYLCKNGPKEPDPRSGGEFHLDGRYATDEPGVLLALAEAFLGPGRSIGTTFFWLRDWLGGGPGWTEPLALVWHDSEVARSAFAGRLLEVRPDRTYYDIVLEILAERGVAVVLA